MKYRPEIDGLRAVAVVPVILFHAGFGLFDGGFVGVDVFFVISGYLITTILVEDIEAKRFSLVRFYERRARRILPALFVVLACTTAASWFVLYPKDFEEYAESLASVVGFASNFYFWKNSNYFALDNELTPLLHTWSLAVEEQYYVLFPPFLYLAWRFGRSRAFWAIAVLAALSLALSEWGWRNKPTANFYLPVSRAWELFAGSLAALVARRRGTRPSDALSLAGLAAIAVAVFAYHENTPFPSVYALLPVGGTVLLILHGPSGTIAAKLLGSRIPVAIGLVSYSAYLWHQPMLALARRHYGVDLDHHVRIAVIAAALALSWATWKFVERPFRDRSAVPARLIWISSPAAALAIAAVALAIMASDGVRQRYDLPDVPGPWADVKCHNSQRIAAYEDPLGSCLGEGGNGAPGDVYLLGDSHAAQMTFPLMRAAERLGKEFRFINTEERGDFPYSFWRNDDVGSDRLFDHLLERIDPGDLILVTMHRGRLNADRDSHLRESARIRPNEKSERFLRNLSAYAARVGEKGVGLVLVNDGPLLSDADTSLEACMHRFRTGEAAPCRIRFSQDDHTRTQLTRVFEQVAAAHPGHVRVLDPLPALYAGAEEFSPISANGEYLMFDRSHLTERGALLLADYFEAELRAIAESL